MFLGSGQRRCPSSAGPGGRGGDVGAGGRRSLGRCTPAKQNCNSAQGFHQVFAAQQTGGCRDRRELRLCGIRGTGLTAGPRPCRCARPRACRRRHGREETGLRFNQNLGRSWFGPSARRAPTKHPHERMLAGVIWGCPSGPQGF